MTISMGICMASEADGPEDLYAKADRALYRSKVNGRNQVTLHTRAMPTAAGQELDALQARLARTDRRRLSGAGQKVSAVDGLLVRDAIGLFQQLRHQESQLDRLVGVEPRIAMRVVAVVQVLGA